MQGLCVLLLGQGRIELDGQALTRLLAPKQQALVFYLAATGGPATRARLATLLWGDRDEAAARTNLRGALSRLRRWLPGVLALDGDAVGFAPAAAPQVDLQALARALAPGAPAADRLAAAAAWRGPLLDGFEAGEAEAFEDWLALARQRARADMQALRQGLLAEAEAAGAHEAVIGHARALLAIDDADEPAHMALMRGLAATGRRTAAIAQYEACRAALAERLGARPSANCYALYTHIHADAPRPAAPPIVMAGPAPAVGSLWGREAELALAEERLADPACSWLTIVGPGGVGKSRLAAEVAAARAGRYRHGVLRLGGRDDAGGALQDAEHLAQQVIERTGADREAPGALLLLLDELEQLPAASGFAALLRERAPGVQVLATSRARLGDHREWLLELQGLALTRTRADDPVSSPSAVLFCAAMRRLLPAFDAAAQGEAVERLVQALGGLPLALELAARSAFDGGVAAVLDRLAAGQWPQDADRGDRHRSLDFVLAEAWRRLDEPARAAAVRLARLPASFDAALAQAIGVDGGTLATLRDQSWLAPDGGDGGRLRFHPLQQAWLQARPGAAALDAPVHGALVRALAAALPAVSPFADLPPAGAADDTGAHSAALRLAASAIGAPPLLAAAARHHVATAPLPALADWIDRAVALLAAAGRPAEAAALLADALVRTDLPVWLAAGWCLRRAELLNDGGASTAALASYLQGFTRLGLCEPTVQQAPWQGLAGAAARLLRRAHWPAAGHPARGAFGDLLRRSLGFAGVMLAFTPDPRPMLRLNLQMNLLARGTEGAHWIRLQGMANGLAMVGLLAPARRLMARADRARPPAGAAADLRLAGLMDEGRAVLHIALGDWAGQVPAIDAVADRFARLGCGRHETETRALAAKLLFFEGRLMEARSRFVALGELALRRPGEAWRAWGPMGLAEVELCLGTADDTPLQRLFDRASQVMTAMENVDAAYTLRRWGLAARLAWRRGDRAAAAAAVQAGVAAAARMQAAWWSHEGHAGLGDTLLALWRHELACGGAPGPLAAAWARYRPALARHVRTFGPAALLGERLLGQQALIAGRRDEGLARLRRAVAHGEHQGMRVELARACDALAAAEADGGWPDRSARLWADLRAPARPA